MAAKSSNSRWNARCTSCTQREPDPSQLEAGVAVVKMIAATEESMKRGGAAIKIGS